LVRIERRRNRFLLCLANIGQDREEREQDFTEVGYHLSDREEKGQVFTEVGSHWLGWRG
jgi:hypothetical protein